ncbi:hypothetical protein CNMCM5793_004733 [Aspergillus hiratsukae]|uniref:Histidine-specific methyltransferase SAM-dependent domain-containing protein n=1 Tax=Aspergillus hiratsukae TaxID=1194566 RepID=A0A8H6PGM2_9EURO|nr:hypothetical protein CNMCM5793_004733 [Aspergillus hiratsukae]KAF7170235.1 hypothetical protein CNMCM6106_005013 [Aspergillus hiratsukae]
MPGLEIYNSSAFPIYEIRRENGGVDLRAQIASGLSLKSPSLPELLLWDEKGLRLFDTFARRDAYYLLDKEFEILEDNLPELTATIPSGSVLVELGCGSLQKTARILESLEKQRKSVRYYALDVSLPGLTNCLAGLTTNRLRDFRFISVTGLCGTYRDCIAWLSEQPDLGDATVSTVTLLWMGNSISNFSHYKEASTMLSEFKQACEMSGLRCQYLVAADGCEDQQRIMDAYDTSSPHLQAFMLNGLCQANTVLGREAFNLEDWSCEAEFSPRQQCLDVYYVPLRDVQVDLHGEGESSHFRCGQRIKAISSGKWTKTLVAKMASLADFQLNRIWGDRSGVYYFYHLTSAV